MTQRRYRIQAADGKWETMNEEMFDYNVLVHLNRLTRTGDYINVSALARSMYHRPTIRTFENVRDSLYRSWQRGDVQRDGDAYRIIHRSSR
jgi:hypothetical protein